ncbi:phosphatase PAP2 family protein [Enterobacteriaceae bacterium LUAb1]
MSWKTLTYFGDSMLLLPTAAIIMWLLAWKSNQRLTAWYWAGLFCLTGIIVCLSKLAFMGWGIGNVRLNFTGFSGHTALAAALWPVMFWLVSGQLSPLLRLLLILCGYFLATLIGLSRLHLNAHSDSEVIAGLILGMLLSAAFLIIQRRTQLRAFSFPQLCITLLIPLLLLSQGKQAKTQLWLRNLSVQLSGKKHPWKRHDLVQQSDNSETSRPLIKHAE